jgi:hypothetical protein
VIDEPETTWRPRERPRRRRRSRTPFLVAAALLLFALGLAFGEALRDNPKPGGTQTIERTVSLVTVAPLTG